MQKVIVCACLLYLGLSVCVRVTHRMKWFPFQFYILNPMHKWILLKNELNIPKTLFVENFMRLFWGWMISCSFEEWRRCRCLFLWHHTELQFTEIAVTWKRYNIAAWEESGWHSFVHERKSWWLSFQFQWIEMSMSMGIAEKWCNKRHFKCWTFLGVFKYKSIYSDKSTHTIAKAFFIK